MAWSLAGADSSHYLIAIVQNIELLIRVMHGQNQERFWLQQRRWPFALRPTIPTALQQAVVV